jgi:hypothetical protein
VKRFTPQGAIQVLPYVTVKRFTPRELSSN